ncbi:peptide chain release factor N(5)-glutamine methyltransferase [Candidatus Parcubacteria bacterium]|jgi:release factor glutamine methyltransferase|nr:MAG: peptide chain release factor N(5)-glutamine methyltransferase [Candidatus Parcubacteria bacterium]
MPAKNLSVQELFSKVQSLITKTPVTFNEAAELLGFTAKKSREFFISHPEYKISRKHTEILFKLLRRRLKGEPFAYLTGKKGFYGLEFKVNENVLIPRPETELLVDWVLKKFPRNSKITIADIGTGSGCIAITLAKYLPQAKILAVDFSSKALTVARQNRRNHGVKNVNFLQSNLLQAFQPTEEIDLVVSNLPYLTRQESTRVLSEPRIALFGGKQGLELIYRLIEEISKRQIPYAILEISPLQQPWLETKMREFGDFDLEFLKDLSQKTRGLIIKKRAK